MLRVVVLWACVAASLGKDLDTAKEQYKKWNTALAGKMIEKDAAKVAALYSTEANFLSYLPLSSPDHIKSTQTVTDYFVDFVKKNPSAPTTTSDFFLKFDDNSFLHSGMVDVLMGDLAPVNKQTTTKARFTYVWKRKDDADDWKIAHHHESVLPAKGRRSGSDLKEAAEEAAPFGAFALAAKAAALPASRRKDAVTAQAEFKKWNDALKSNRWDTQVKPLYISETDKLSVLPQDSPDHIKDLAALEKYFDTFLKKNPNCIITDELVQAYNDNKIFVHSGLYTCMLGEMSKQVATASRFTFVWKDTNTDTTKDPAWRIVHHHSSVVPVPPCT
jgi:hypothetical protein